MRKGETYPHKGKPRKTAMPSETRQEVVRLYEAGTPTPEICRRVGYCRSTCNKVLNAEGVTLRPKVGTEGPVRLDPEIEAEVIAGYLAGASFKNLSAFCGMSECWVRRMVRAAGCAARPSGTPRIHQLDETAFDEITEASAYWVGFLMADGCVSRYEGGSATITLCLARQDAEHVLRFREFVGSTHTVWVGEEGQHHLAFRSDRMAEALARFGVVPHKSLTAEVAGLEDDPHFWRGVIDGDGCLGWHSQEKHPLPLLNVVGSKPLLEQFMGFVRRLFPRSRANVGPTHSRAWTFSIVGHSAYAVVKALYGECHLALPRKWETARALLQWQALRGNPPPYTTDELTALRDLHGGWKPLARALGVTYGKVHWWRDRLGMLGPASG